MIDLPEKIERFEISDLWMANSEDELGWRDLKDWADNVAGHIEALARDVAALTQEHQLLGDAVYRGHKGLRLDLSLPDVQQRLETLAGHIEALARDAEEQRTKTAYLEERANGAYLAVLAISERLENLASGDITELRGMVGELGDRVRDLGGNVDRVIRQTRGLEQAHQNRSGLLEREIHDRGRDLQNHEKRIQALEAAKEADSKLHHEMDEKLHHVDVGTQSDRQELEDRLGAIERLLGVKAPNLPAEDTYRPPSSDDVEFPKGLSVGEISNRDPDPDESLSAEVAAAEAYDYRKRAADWEAIADDLAENLQNAVPLLWVSKAGTKLRARRAFEKYEAMKGKEGE